MLRERAVRPGRVRVLLEVRQGNLYFHQYTCHKSQPCTLKHSIIRCKIVTGVNHHQYTKVPERTFFNFQRSFPAIFQFCNLTVELPPSIYLTNVITNISLIYPPTGRVANLWWSFLDLGKVRRRSPVSQDLP